ncbi:AraC family transcriptional regulator [Spirosoma humi]
MNSDQRIPVHRMDDWVAGVYLKAAGGGQATSAYERVKPHRHDFYYCVLIDKGELELEVDFQPIKLTDQTLFLSYPGQIHQVNWARVERGWFLAFDPALLDEGLRSLLDQRLSEVIFLPLSPGQSTHFFSFIGHVHTVYGDPAQLFRQPVIQSLVIAFVYQLVSAYLSMEQSQLIRHSSRSIEITKAFKQLLRRNFKSMKRPAHFAAHLHMSVSHLTDTVRSVTGFPITYFIQQELMREAQRLLYYSDLSVKEIAEVLGFEDAQYFNRLFHKVVGVAPGAFRKQSELSIHA